MNNARRKQLAEIVDQMQELRARLDELQSEEQEAFDNMPESLQQGEKGQQSEAAAERIGNAGDSLDEAINAIEEAQE
ncbi:TPA: hypothetical protein ACPIDV_000484 [Pseudomonas aeruginosa]